MKEPSVEVRVCRAAAVVVQRIPAAAADWFLEWQRGVTAAAEAFAGYRGTDVYPPAGGGGDEWVVLIHFDDDASLRQWLGSPVRAEWVGRLQEKVGAFEMKVLQGGFGFWFAGRMRGTETVPPEWKMVLTVLLGLYPTVMLLTIFVGPYTSRLGLAVSMLIGNALSVSILQWVVMPPLTRLLGPWLRARPGDKRLSLAGLVLLLVALAAMTALFRLAAG